MLICDEHSTTNRDQQKPVFYSNSQETDQRKERELESSDTESDDQSTPGSQPKDRRVKTWTRKSRDDSEHQHKPASRQTDREEYKRNQLIKSSTKDSDAQNKPSSHDPVLPFWSNQYNLGGLVCLRIEGG